jgi:hypothetical protein
LIIWVRRVIAKHNLLRLVQTKVTLLEWSVQEFKDLFQDLFIKGIPPFWDGRGKLYVQEEYNTHLT